MKTYYFGNKNRITNLIDLKDARKINLINIFFITSKDRIFYVKAWSLLVVFFLIFNKRPTIIQVADGLITESNCTKKINNKPHFLYEKIYGDYLLINQSILSIPNFIDKKFVATNIEYQLTEKLIDFNEIAIVLGNDPFINKEPKQVKREILALLQKVPATIKITVCCPSNDIKHMVNQISPRIITTNRFNVCDYPNKDTLFISTPSTIGHKLLLLKKNVVSLGKYDCCTMTYLFNNSEQIEYADGKFQVRVKTLTNKTMLQYEIDALSKRNYKTTFFDLIAIASFRRLASDLKSLIS